LAQYYQAVSRLDQGFGYLLKTLKDAGVYDDTLIVFISDHGIAMPGAKTTVYEPGLNSPCIVRYPNAKQRGIKNAALISWVDITPTLLDYAGIITSDGRTLSREIATMPGGGNKRKPYQFHGRSF